MNSYILVAVVLYTAWAIYSGYKYVNGRYPWLEQPEIAHRICKYAAILGIYNNMMIKNGCLYATVNNGKTYTDKRCRIIKVDGDYNVTYLS